MTVAQRKIVTRRMRAFQNAVTEQASAGLQQFRHIAERYLQEQDMQQERLTSAPDDGVRRYLGVE